MVLWHNLSWALQIIESLSKAIASKALIATMTAKTTIEVRSKCVLIAIALLREA